MLSLKPLNFTDINHYSFAERLDLIQGNSGTYYAQIVRLEDALIAPQGIGPYASSHAVSVPVRYVPAAGATVQLVFPRSLSVAATPANQDVTVTATVADARDTSIYRFDLTSSNIDKIVSEGAKLVITEDGVAKTYPIDHLVRRRSNTPGA